MSETANFRRFVTRAALHRIILAQKGIDLGSGGDPISDNALSVDITDKPPYGGRVDRILDASKSLPFKDGEFDFVYSSHLLEDFDNPFIVLKEWLRILKPRGWLFLLVPHRTRYQEHCKANGTLPNQAHRHEFEDGELTNWLLNSGLVGFNNEYKMPPYTIVIEAQRIYE